MRKFVIIMVSFTAVCLIAAVALTAVNKGRDIPSQPAEDWDTFIDGRGDKVDQTQEASLDGVTSVSVRSSSDRIQLHYGDEGEVRVHFHGSIRSSRVNTPIPALRMQQAGSEVSFWLDYPSNIGSLYYSRNTVVDVYLPESYAGNLKLDTSSGGIGVEGYAFSELSCDASSGSVDVRNVSADRLSVDTSSGSIDIKGINARHLDVSATSGSISGGDITAESIELETSSGGIRLTGVKGDIQANASSGTIRIEDVSDADKVSAQASSGSIHMSFTTMGSEYRFNTNFGSVNVAFPSDAAFTIDFDTNSGSFHSDFPVTTTKTGRDSVEGYVVDDRNKVVVDTSSGSCRINIR